VHEVRLAPHTAPVLDTVRSILRALWRYLSFARFTDEWSPLSATQRAERYESWPTWRRSVRPIGVGIYWAGVAWFAPHSDHKTPQLIVPFIVWAALILTFMAIGIRDWTLARAALKLARAARAARADRASKAPSDHA
jgi:hypothetical protein